MLRLVLSLFLLAVSLAAQPLEWRGVRFLGVVEPVAVGSTIAVVVWSTDSNVALQFLPGAQTMTLHGIGWIAARPVSSVSFVGEPSAGCTLPSHFAYRGPAAPSTSGYWIGAGCTLGPVPPSGACVPIVTNYLWDVPDAMVRGIVVSPALGWF